MKFFKIVFFTVLIVFLSSCGSKKKSISTKVPEKKSEQKEPLLTPNTDSQKVVNSVDSSQVIVVTVNKTTQGYIEQYADIAMTKMREHNIPASITLAQGVLESSSGNSKLTKESNNHFGIKCHKEWEGRKVYWDDDAKGECFRVYDQPEGSFEDHSQFLVTRSRYASLFQLNSGDYVGWAYGLKKAGYATDPAYPQKLIGIIERYKLFEYDQKVLGKEPVLTKVKLPEEKYTVQKGDVLYAIAKKHNMTVEELKSINKLSSDSIKAGQVLDVKKTDKVVVAEKNNVGEPQKQDINVESTLPTKIPEYHMVQAGETLYAIAKKYHVNVEDLKSINHLTGDNLSVDQKLYLLPKTVQVKDSGMLSVKDTDAVKALVPVVKDTIVENNKGVHVVQKGEGLYAISRKYGVTIDQLKAWNGLANDAIDVGQVLKITPPDTLVKREVENVQPDFESDKTLKQDTFPKTHVVQKGETFYQIAYKYNLEIPYLRKLNRMTDDEVFEGQVIYLTDKVEFDADTHLVQKGETLYSISRKYGVSVEKLIELNNIQNNTIKEGERLKIK